MTDKKDQMDAEKQKEKTSKPETTPYDPYFSGGDIEDNVSGTNKDFDDKVGPRPFF